MPELMVAVALTLISAPSVDIVVAWIFYLSITLGKGIETRIVNDRNNKEKVSMVDLQQINV